MKTITTLPICTAIAAVAVAHSAAAAPSSIAEMFSEGSAKASFRYRYEMVDQDGIANDANASTLKSRVTFTTASYKSFTGGLEFDNVTVIGDERYRTPTNGKTQYPIVADPKGTDLNQAYVKYTADGANVTVGRQRINVGSQRFIGGVGFRQNEQTYDALRIDGVSLGEVKLDYTYVNRVNRIFGPDDSVVQPKAWDSESHFVTATYSPAEGHTLSAYAYMLDFENSPGNASDTLGIDYSGKIGPISVLASYASQSEAGDNPVDYSADYYLLELTAKLSEVNVTIGQEVLGSDDGVKGFATPLATLHKFQGFADLFLGTPANGIEDTYIKAAGALGGVKLAFIYHDFSANEGSADYGSEYDLVAGYAFNTTYSVELKYAHYDADNFGVDTDKMWLTLEAKY